MKIKVIREFERGQGQGNTLDRYIILTILLIPSFTWKMGLFLVLIGFLFYRDLKFKKAKSENLLADPIYYYSYFPFSKEDFLRAWLIDDLDVFGYLIFLNIFNFFASNVNFNFKSIFAAMALYLFFVGIFKPIKIHNIFYNDRNRSALYKAYLIIASILLIVGGLYTWALLSSISSSQNLLIEKIITRQSLIGASIISFAIYIFGNIIALVDWDKTYKEK